MSDQNLPEVGTIGWIDLTIGDAAAVRDFYSSVVGWKVEPVQLDGYSDFAMTSPATGEPCAGVCHARGQNADLPPQWLIYITVENVEASVQRCLELDGEVVDGPRQLGEHGSFAVIRDPAGAVAALFQPAS